MAFNSFVGWDESGSFTKPTSASQLLLPLEKGLESLDTQSMPAQGAKGVELIRTTVARALFPAIAA